MVIPKLVTSSLILLALSAGDKAENAREKAALSQAKLTLLEAIAASAEYFSGGTVLGAEVDTEDGVPSYVIDIEKNGSRHRVLVDIRSGKLTIAPPEADDVEPMKDHVI